MSRLWDLCQPPAIESSACAEGRFEIDPSLRCEAIVEGVGAEDPRSVEEGLRDLAPASPIEESRDPSILAPDGRRISGEGLRLRTQNRQLDIDDRRATIQAASSAARHPRGPVVPCDAVFP